MNLEEQLRESMRLTDPQTIQALLHGIEDAGRYQRSLKGIYDHGASHKEFREAVTRLHNALAKLARGTAGKDTNLTNAKHYLSMIPKDYRTLFDQQDRDFYFSEPWPPGSTRFEAAIDGLRAMPSTEQQARAERLRGIVESLIDDLATPGKGGARKEAKRCIMGIQCLMRHFSEALPDNPITPKTDSLFYRYVVVWMEFANYAVDQKPTPERHIQNAIANLGNLKNSPFNVPRCKP